MRVLLIVIGLPNGLALFGLVVPATEIIQVWDGNAHDGRVLTQSGTGCFATPVPAWKPRIRYRYSSICRIIL